MNCVKHNHQVKLSQFKTSQGLVVDQLEVDCCLWGDLNKPLIVVMGGISANRWAIDSSEHGEGWWRQLINQDAVLNLHDYCYLTFEYFSFDESVRDPSIITTTDQAKILFGIKDELQLPQFHAVIGASYGGMVSLSFAALFPDCLKKLICIAAADRNSVKAQALRYIQRQIIRLGLGKQNTHEKNRHLALARSLAVIGYRGEVEFEQRFKSNQPGTALASVGSYLDYQGQKFTERFSSSRYLQLSESIDQHQVDVSTIQVPTHLIAFLSDQLVPLPIVEELKEKIPTDCQLSLINSRYGHDGFLLETAAINQIFKPIFNSTNNDEQKYDTFEPNHRRASGY